MRKRPWVTYFWPGLPQLYTRGNWSALAIAVGASVMLNLALLVSFAWSELIAADVRSALWAALAFGWAAAVVFSVVCNCREGAAANDRADDAFTEALEHYLKGNWFKARRALDALLAKNARDLDARLMLATLLRHTGQLDEADQQLQRLTRLEGAQKWAWEIQRERELLAQSRRKSETPAEHSIDPPGEMTRAA